jgi:Uma2 family endonuclease
MATVTKLGPADHGRPISYDQYLAGDYEAGYKYELINGELCVSPEANYPEDRLRRWIDSWLSRYARQHPDVINYVTASSRVFVPGRRATTCPEPDLAAYHDFPRHLPSREVTWGMVSPVLVIEVLVDGPPEKDLVRNVDLYLRTPSIREYWVIDGRENPDRPTLITHRRFGQRWVVRGHPFGSTYTPRLLPGFNLVIDPRVEP